MKSSKITQFNKMMELAKKEYEQHIAEINEKAEQVYNAYLPQGEEIAATKKLIYIEHNAKNMSEFF
jgi:hypothetical protein